MYRANLVSCGLLVYVGCSVVATLGCKEHATNAAALDGAPSAAVDPRPSPDGKRPTASSDNAIEAKVMLRGYCIAGADLKHQSGLGGHYRADNMPQPTTTMAAQSTGTCYLLAEPNIVTEFQGGKGMRLVLVNGADELVTFDACDSRLSIVQEACVDGRTWRPIEYLPQSWCGNSYHSISLQPQTFWAFAAPRFQGPLPAKLRFRLAADEHHEEIVSNEFAGGIHPEQFTAKQEYAPGNLMDPYLPVTADEAAPAPGIAE